MIKVIKLKSGYKRNHKNTFNSYIPKRNFSNTDYTLNMLAKIFKPVGRKVVLNDRTFRVLDIIE